MAPTLRLSHKIKPDVAYESPQEAKLSEQATDSRMTRNKQKDTTVIKPAYLIYVILRTKPKGTAEVVVRKAYNSRIDGAAAFKREYIMWTTKGEDSLYPQQHTDQQLSLAHVANLLKSAADGTKKIEYEVVHRDDRNMNKEDEKKRSFTVVCEKTTFELL